MYSITKAGAFYHVALDGKLFYLTASLNQALSIINRR